MNPVNATALYVSASRSVLQCDPRDPRALAELCKLLPFFRQSLSCLVCGNLLQDPIAPTDSSCQHYVCRGCKGQRMQLKPSCSWCKDYSRFQENRQLSLLVHCYKKLCLYIAQSPLAPHIAAAADDSPDLQAILEEGLALVEGEPPDAEELSAGAGQSQDAVAPEAGRAGPTPDAVPAPALIAAAELAPVLSVAAVPPVLIAAAALAPALSVAAVPPALSVAAAVAPVLSVAAALAPALSVAAVPPALSVAAAVPPALSVAAALAPVLSVAAAPPALSVAAVLAPVLSAAAVPPALSVAAVPPALAVAAVPPALSVAAPPLSAAAVEESSPAAGVNGLHQCNGLAEADDMLLSVAVETGRGPPKPEVLGGELPACVSVTASGAAGVCDIDAFGEDPKHDGGSLLLSVEEVLRTLDTEPEPDPAPTPAPAPATPAPLQAPSSTPAAPTPPPSTSSSSSSLTQSSFNGPHYPTGADSSRLTPSIPPDNCPQPQQAVLSAVPRAPPRCHRKRSRSESDSEKIQFLPISSLLRNPPTAPSRFHHHPGPGAATAANTTATPITPTAAAAPTTKREHKFPHPTHQPLPHLAPVPNGGPPKVGKTVLVTSKGLKKTVELHGVPKKAYSKARQGAPKPRTQPRDRVPPHPHAHPIAHPPSPSKPLYKKPVEKKGCKCGRATQNPSVLTCRGQRCPCYSNRKACQDCICRGCQNSYMANGEKKLEAFAVPEKALEQTRLTLGINLTSIAAAALRNPATSGAPGNTLINVTTATGTPVTAAFLSGAGHDNRVFDDSLEVRFDC